MNSPDASQPWRILIVEDEVLVGMFLADVLMDLGHTVVASVESMGGALQVAGREKIDLAMVDLSLAGEGDGIETARRLYEQHGVRTILMSGASQAAINERAQAVRALGTLVKPYTEGEVVAALQTAAKELPSPS
jgi:DNA-binding NarL/FixJ family response regulator